MVIAAELFVAPIVLYTDVATVDINMPRRSQRISKNSRHVYPINTPADRRLFKVRFNETFVSTTAFDSQWDPGQFQGPLASYAVSLSRPGTVLNDVLFNDGKLSSVSNESSSQVPGDNIIGNSYGLAYLSSVTIKWSVMRSDHSSDFPIQLCMVPFNYFQLLHLHKVNGIVWPGPSTVPDDHAWSNIKQFPNKRLSMLTNPFGDHTTCSVKIHVPIKKYTYPGFPNATNQWWHNTNNGGFSGWSTLDPSFSAYLLLAAYLPFGAGDTILTHKFEVTQYITAFMPYVPSDVLYQPQPSFTLNGPADIGPWGPQGQMQPGPQGQVLDYLDDSGYYP